MTTTRKANGQPTADVSKPGSGYTSAATATGQAGYTAIVPQEATPFNPQIVQCLRILARRGRLIREERERAARAEQEAMTPGDDAERLIHYDTKILASNTAGGD